MKKNLFLLTMAALAALSVIFAACEEPMPETGNDLVTFSVSGIAGYIDRKTNNVRVDVPHSTTEIIPAYTLSKGASIEPQPQGADFPDTKTYTVKAENGDKQDYTITVTKAAGIDITITEPEIWDYTSDTLTLSKSGANDIDKTKTITTETFNSRIWTVDNVFKSATDSIVLNAADYTVDKHQLNLTVYQLVGSRWYSKDLEFTVVE
jgi:hypothetical protein